VREFTLEDGISRLFKIDLDVTSTNPAVDFEAVIGREATFHVELSGRLGAKTPTRLYKGIVEEIHQAAEEERGLSTYHIVVVPRLWLLTQRTNCRVFQQMTDLDVARALLTEWGFDPVLETLRPQKTRKYRVQYNESDFAFMSRMLEASGVSYLHRQVGDGSQLVLLDAPEKAEPRRDAIEHVGDPVADQVWATRFRATRKVRHGKVTFADHDHRLANEPLLAESVSSENPVESKLERFQYVPGAFRYGNKGPADTPAADDRGRTRTDPTEAQTIADQTAAALQAGSHKFSFFSNAIDLAAGSVLKIAGNARAEQLGALLVTRTVMKGSFDRAPTVTSDAVSASSPHHPERSTPQPSVQGVECATVVGPAGETIHCDEFGRVRVQFHWDRYGKRDQNSSCWIHVNQPWAGEGFGAINIPRIGQEVIVEFLGGNPEEPVIVGRMHTNLNRPPMALPANKTQEGFRSSSVPHTGGFNEMMFEDKAGQELIRMRAEKDWSTRVNNDQSTSIGNTRSTSIDSHDTEKVGGNQTQSVAGAFDQTIAKDAITKVLQNAGSFVGADRVLGTTGALSSNAKTHAITSEKGTVIQVGSSTIYIGPDGIIVQAHHVLLNPGEEVLKNAVVSGKVPTAGAPS